MDCFVRVPEETRKWFAKFLGAFLKKCAVVSRIFWARSRRNVRAVSGIFGRVPEESRMSTFQVSGGRVHAL